MSRPPDPVGDELLLLAADGDPARLVALRLRVQSGEAPAYVAGFLSFGGRRFHIDPRAFITDPETWWLTEVVLEQGRKLAVQSRPRRILEFGVGAGTLAITVKLSQPEWAVSGIDIDAAALELAAENARLHGVDIDLAQSDYLSGWPATAPEPDIIFGDPPWGGAEDLYDGQRDENYYLQMPAVSAFPPGGERTGIHDCLIRSVVERGWDSTIILNYGVLPRPVIAQSAAPLGHWTLAHPQPGISVLIGRR
jgi:methylase of polypeptide subunit release factors